MTKLLIVTPLHNEEDNLPGLVQSLRAQTFRDFEWVMVDDGSTDGTSLMVREVAERVNATAVTKDNDGGLIGGSAYTSWRFGIARAPLPLSEYTHIMKLDADVRLPPDYLDRAIAAFSEGDNVGIVGGRIDTPGMREQVIHVPGPVKMYSLAAYLQTEELPSAIGFDVIDEVAAGLAGLRTVVLRDLKFDLSRAIGASQGGVHGRYRNGRMCRWTGYDGTYFAAHALRYVFRKPYAIGAIAMIVGFLRAGRGPYPTRMRAAHRDLQRAKLRTAAVNPFRFLRETY